MQHCEILRAENLEHSTCERHGWMVFLVMLLLSSSCILQMNMLLNRNYLKFFAFDRALEIGSQCEALPKDSYTNGAVYSWFIIQFNELGLRFMVLNVFAEIPLLRSMGLLPWTLWESMIRTIIRGEWQKNVA